LVIAGLANRQRSTDDAGLPGLVRIPGAGRLFGTRGQRGEESEIVIFLTPRIAAPAEAPAVPAGRGATMTETDAVLLERAQGRIEALRTPQTTGEGRP
jgi:type II secretory pathway component GspD/PulD (secretin)